MWKTVLVWFGIAIVTFLLLVAVIVWVYYYLPHGVLPSRHAMTQMPPGELEGLVLKITPLGTTRADVEQALIDQFRRTWVEDSASAENLANNYDFHVPISEGSYSLRSQFAVDGAIIPDVTNVYFLFGPDDALKDVRVDTYHDTL